ncbi:aldehyde dehydrogenase family protein [Streptomyces sp. MBT53]|uniref:aldehyde dehydrogenase family protein n=1 Tax=Streptomyces sp. MBT53 TaxID=1488384 RepID=UPI0019116B4E|nr:aldehyde dehydrogenase family protein [Streptomyces sp. MBT53]MBK6010920.1 aldehyde dehydrogenase family protein [Streptomyces sp. MBT53]
MIDLPAFGTTGAYRARNIQTVTDVAGTALAELSLVPPLYVNRTMAALRRGGIMPADERADAMTRAAELFATGTIDGLTAEEYQHAVSRVGGVPISSVVAATTTVAERVAKAHASVQYARPQGAVDNWRDPLTRTGRSVWTRRGDVFAVHAAGNHPGTHSIWPEALALGYRVAVRPSSRDPFTPHRLVAALRSAGFADDQVVLLPTDHAGADAVLRGADLGMVYGGEEVTRKYGGAATVLPQGPGRSKILITADVDWRDHLDVIVASVSGHGGTGCVNTTAVFVEGDPAPLAEAIAARLSAATPLPPEDDKAVLPVQPVAVARAIETYLLKKAAGARPWLGGDGVVAELGDGSAALLPAVFQLDDPAAPQAGVELPFPCVWIAPWTPEAGTAPLKNTLVLNAMTHDIRLVDRLLDEPTISNLYVGSRPTYWMDPSVPHDGYLADFLMRNKGVIRNGLPVPVPHSDETERVLPCPTP